MATVKKPAPKNPKPKIKAEKPVKYPKIVVEQRTGDNGITADEMKQLIGWEEDTPESKFTDFVEAIELESGRRVRLNNNTRNRPIVKRQLAELEQSLLRKRWKMNPSGFGIGMYGGFMDGQHRGISLITAQEKINNNPELQKQFPEPLRMDCVIVYGLDESDETFQVLNSGVPASTSDVLYRRGLFSGRKSGDREKLCKITEKAVKNLRVRTGESKVIYDTNSECVDFLERHKKVVDCVLHITEEYASGPGHAQRMSPGFASALMYLMAVSKTEVGTYLKKRTEKVCDLSMMEKAEEFWTLLCKGDGEWKILQDRLTVLSDPKAAMSGFSGLVERKLIIIKAWNLFSKGEKITEDGIRLDTVRDDKKELDIINEFPVIDGIDLGEGQSAEETEKGDTEVTEDEVESEKERIVEEKSGEKSEKEKDLETIDRLHDENPGLVLLFLTSNGEYLAWEKDAHFLSRALNLPVKNWMNGLQYVGFKEAKIAEVSKKLKNLKKKAGVVSTDYSTVTPLE